MPSTTFFNLPAQKRDRLLDAARAEFARVPYPDASINQIIRVACIPRGSFYMYFRDKEELFSFLILESIRKAEALVVQLIAAHRGNPFAAFPAVFDYVLRTAKDPEGRATYEAVFQIVSRNGATVIAAFVEQVAPSILEATKREIDPALLDLRAEGDLEACVTVLMSLTAGAVKDGLLGADPAAVRRRFLNTLDILARGMARATK